MADFIIPPEILDSLPTVRVVPLKKLWLVRNPDWSTWRYLLKARLFQCVALSCEVSPHNAREYLEYFKECHEICREEGRECGEPCEEEKELPIALCTFRDRLKVAIASLSPDGPLKPLSEYPEGEPINAEISLSDFADFAESIGWLLPDEFPRKPTVRNTEPDTKASETSAVDGRPAERQSYLSELWIAFDRPKGNKTIWAELKKRQGKDSCPVKQVVGHEEFTWHYNDGTVEPLTRKTFQNDMTAVRARK